MVYFGASFTVLGLLLIVSPLVRKYVNFHGPDWLIRLYLFLCTIGKRRFIILFLLIFIALAAILICIPPTAWETELPLGAFVYTFWAVLLLFALFIISFIFYLSKISIELSDKFVIKYTNKSEFAERLATFFALFGGVQLVISFLLYIDAKYMGNYIQSGWGVVYSSYKMELQVIITNWLC